MRFTLWPLCCAIWLGISAATLAADDPSARLPERTCAYVRVADWRALVRRMEQSTWGRLLSDAETGPFIARYGEQLLDSAFPASALARREDDVGVLAAELRALPRLPLGEVTVAVVRNEEGDQGTLWLLSHAPEEPAVARLIDAWLNEQEKNGVAHAGERVARDDWIVCEDGTSVCRREKLCAIASSPQLLREALEVLDGRAKSLADRADYSAATGAPENLPRSPPQVSWYCDGRFLLSSLAGFDPAALLDESVREKLALERIGPLRGSLWIAEREFDLLVHATCGLPAPRRGVARLVAAPGEDDVAIERWVDDRAAAYATIHLDGPRLLREFDALAQEIAPRGELQDALAREISPRDQKRGDALLPLLSGRVSQAQLPGGSIAGIHLRGASAPGEIKKRIQQSDEATRERSSVTADGVWLMASEQAMREAIAPDTPRLRDALDVKLLAAKAARFAHSHPRLFFGVLRPEGYLEPYHAELAEMVDASPQPAWAFTVTGGALLRTLKEEPLPAWSAFRRHLAPWGATAWDDGEALHIVAFALRRKG